MLGRDCDELAVTLDDKLSAGERETVLNKITSLDGVFSAHFNNKANSEIRVDYWTKAFKTEEKVRRLPGVKTTRKDDHSLMPLD